MILSKSSGINFIHHMDSSHGWKRVDSDGLDSSGSILLSKQDIVYYVMKNIKFGKKTTMLSVSLLGQIC